MGMFDTVHFFCPYCDDEIKEQSKAGKCDLNKYHQISVPANIAEDLINNKVICCVCDKVFFIKGTIPRVSLRLEDKKKGNGYD